jgi:predicted RNA-binding Zn ribbon-like protein
MARGECEEGPGESEEAAGAGEPAVAADSPDGDVALCPEPASDDLDPAARLRDGLAAALTAPDDAVCAAALTALSRAWGLFPGLDASCVRRTYSAGKGFMPRLAAELVPAAMDVAATGRRHRIRPCDDPSCGLPFLDSTRDGRARYCSLRCSNRSKGRRRRARSINRTVDGTAWGGP